ncbi:Uncharacterized protein dnm_031050 [Desulfonema magnum]|uniref:Uncharacterized protein n=1 Tax=Desulfonema magnum TaxID=45655 RepID=A0A975BL20_9BACT|nr:Uncharacterized protein dnm_031050 [Desulfonema magnum]
MKILIGYKINQHQTICLNNRPSGTGRRGTFAPRLRSCSKSLPDNQENKIRIKAKKF